MVIYISGPMMGYDFYNFPEFDKYAGRLKAKGWNVVNPADIDRMADGFDPYDLPEDWDWEKEPEGFDRDRVMARDLEMIDNYCDAIFMIPGWEESPGAKQELDRAKERELQEYYYEDGIPEHDIPALSKCVIYRGD